MAVEDKGQEIDGVAIQFIVLAVGSFGLRVYVRAHMVKAWGWDDWLMTAAFFTFLFFMANIMMGVAHGLGRRFRDLSEDDIELALKFWIFSYIWYSWTMILSKLSIAIFLARIVVAKIYRWILYATMVISVVTGLGFFFVMLFQCQPVEYFWERKPGVDGQCMPVDVIIIVTYVYSGLNILCDFTLALLPVTIVWSLHMPLKMKLATFSLLSMGCIASTGVVLRLRFVQNYRDADFLFATVEIAIWSVVEAGLAITAGSLACVRPLFKLALQRLGLSTSDDLFPAQSSHYALPTGNASVAATRRSARSHRATMHSSSEMLAARKGEGHAEDGLGAGFGSDGKAGELIAMGSVQHGQVTSPIRVKVVQGGGGGATLASTPEADEAESPANSSHAGGERRQPTGTYFI